MSDPAHAIEVSVIVEEGQVVLDRGLGDQAIDGAVERDSIFATIKINAGGSCIGLLLVLRAEEPVRFQIAFDPCVVLFGY